MWGVVDLHEWEQVEAAAAAEGVEEQEEQCPEDQYSNA